MPHPTHDLPRLLAELDPHAELAERHLWLIHVLEWVRAAEPSVEVALGRVESLVAAIEADADLRQRLQAWWLAFIDRVDITTLLADFGFAPRTAMITEVSERLRHKLLPGTPETIDAWPSCSACCCPATRTRTGSRRSTAPRCNGCLRCC